MKNVGLKITSLVISILLFFFVNDKSNVSNISVYVPVRVEGLGKDRMILRPNNRQAIVTLSGPSFVISKIDTKDLAFKVELPKDIKDHYLFRLPGESLDLPRSVEVVSVEPAEMELVLDTLNTRELPIIVPKVGRLQEDRELLNVKFEPQTVTVTCPESEMRRITSVETAPIDLSTLTHNLERQVDLLSPSPYCQLSEKEVLLSATLSSVNKEKVVKGIPIKVKGSSSFVVIPDKVNIEVSAAEEKIKTFKDHQVSAFIEVDNNSKLKNYPVKIALPSGFSLVYSDPASVKIEPKK